MTKNKFYITTAIDYANSVVHIGHSYQKMLADSIARYKKSIGKDTFFLTGTDEHGEKVQKSAKDKKVDPKKFVDKISKKDKAQWKSLNISYDRFIRTTDEDHKKFVKKFYSKVEKNGDIYLDTYEGLYCEGCEAFVDRRELVEEKCPYHPNKKPKKIKEKNLFFKLSRYEKFLLDHIKKNPDFIMPEKRRNEVVAFIKGGLKDFSISRQNVSWGIPVPGNPGHTIYVWFDALINYLTFANQKDCWPADVHVLGKDNLRFHAIYWPAMLKSAGYDLPKTILTHEFITLDGKKISKSLGNVIRPTDLVKKYGTDAARYFFLRYGPLNNDIDVTISRIEEVYQADLANGLGNLVSRVAGMSKKESSTFKEPTNLKISNPVAKHLDNYQVDKALEEIWKNISIADSFINERKVWDLGGSQRKAALQNLVNQIRQIATDIAPFMPETSEKILKRYSGNKIKEGKALFPRLN